MFFILKIFLLQTIKKVFLKKKRHALTDINQRNIKRVRVCVEITF